MQEKSKNSIMRQELSFFQNTQVRNLIIFLIVSGFAIQALLLIIDFGLDIPGPDDIDQIFLGYRIANNLEVAPQDFYDPYGGHVTIFIKLLTIPFLLTFSFLAAPTLYLNWIFLCIAIIFIYYLLKQTNEKSTWLLIPISMLVFSPLQESTFTNTLIGLHQTIPFLSFVIIIFLLNTKKLNFYRISLALFFVAVTMFSNTFGLVVWPIMILSLIKQDKNRKKWLAIWIFGGLCMSVLLLTLLVGGTCGEGEVRVLPRCGEPILERNFSDLFSSEKIYAFFFSLGSMAFRVKFNEVYIIVGVVIIISFLVGLLYTLYNRKKLSSIIPWCQFGLLGLIFISILTITRFQVWNGESLDIELHYLRLENFLHIGLLVLATELFTHWKNKISKNRKRLLNVLLIIFILSVILMLIPSYTIGWKNAEAASDWKNDVQSGCLLLPAKTKYYDSFEYCSESFLPKYYVTLSDRQKYAPEIWNFFLKNKYNVFYDENFNESNSKDLIEFTKKWNDSRDTSVVKKGEVYLQQTSTFNGAKEKIKSKNIISDEIFQLDNFQVAIQGSIKNIDFDQIDHFYLFLNDQPFVRIVDFEDSQNNLILWRTVFLSGYVPAGCHEFSLGIIEDSSKSISLDQVKFCKTE